MLRHLSDSTSVYNTKLRILATGNFFSETCVMKTYEEINKILKYRVRQIPIFGKYLKKNY